MSQWKLAYVNSVESWLDALGRSQLRSLAKELRLLEMCGHRLRLPHSKSLGNGLFELRERRYGLCLYYGYQEREIILIHGGDKGSQSRDIVLARKKLVAMTQEVV